MKCEIYTPVHVDSRSAPRRPAQLLPTRARGRSWCSPLPEHHAPHLLTAWEWEWLDQMASAEQRWPSGATRKLQRIQTVLHDIAESAK